EEGRRKDAGHDDLDQLAMAVDDAQIRDRAHELRHLADLLADRPDEDPLGGRVVAKLLFPESEEGGQAQLAPKRKPVRVAEERSLQIGRPRRERSGPAEDARTVTT